MFEDAIDAILGDLTPGFSPAAARVNALRNQPQGGASGSFAPDQPPPPPQPPMPPQAAPMAASAAGSPGMGPPGGPPPPMAPNPQPSQTGSSTGSFGPPGGPPPGPGGMPMQPPPARTALPQATGKGNFPQPAPKQPDTPVLPTADTDPLLREEQVLRERQQALFAEQSRATTPIDRSALEAAVAKRREAGDRGLLMAMAAQQAGKGFEPMQAHFLKQSAQAHEPVKMQGGVLTDEGFIEDPAYQHDINVRRADAQLKAIDAALQNNLTQQERRRLEQAQKEWQASLQRSQTGMQWAIAQQASADRQAATESAHQDRQAALGAKGTKFTAKEQSDLDAHNAMTAGLAGAITALSNVKSDRGTGWVAGAIQNKIPGGEALVAKMRDPTVRNAVQQLTYVTDAIRHERFGSALTVPEKASAMQYLPGEYDDIPRMLEKAKGLANLVALNNQRLVAKGQMAEQVPGAPGGGQPGAPGAPQAGKPAGPPQAKPVPQANSNEGRTIVNAQGQRLKMVQGKWVPQ